MFCYCSYVAGVLTRERLPGFMRLLWFACRGNIFIRHTEMEEPILDSATVSPVLLVRATGLTCCKFYEINIVWHLVLKRKLICWILHKMLFSMLYLQGESIWKVVFVAFFQGEQLKSRVKKICEG